MTWNQLLHGHTVLGLHSALGCACLDSAHVYSFSLSNKDRSEISSDKTVTFRYILLDFEVSCTSSFDAMWLEALSSGTPFHTSAKLRCFLLFCHFNIQFPKLRSQGISLQNNAIFSKQHVNSDCLASSVVCRVVSDILKSLSVTSTCSKCMQVPLQQ